MSEEDLRELSRLRREKRKLARKKKLCELSTVCNQMGEILSRQGKYEEALQEHRDEEEACHELKDFLGVAIANRKIGECHSELGRFTEALEHQRKHLEIAISLNNLVEEQRAWATIGRTHLYQAEIPADDQKSSCASTNTDTLEALNCAEEAFLKSLDLCSRLKSDVAGKELAQMQGRLFLNLGLVLEQRGDLDACSQFVQKAIDINKEHLLVNDLQRCHHSLCLIYKRHGQLETALSHVQEAIKATTKTVDLEEECELLTLHGHIYLLMSDFKSAKQALKKTRKKMAALPDGKIKADAFRIWKTAAKLCAAEERLLCLESDDLDVSRTTYEKMGDLCCRVENYEKAIHFYHRSLELTKVLGLGNKNLAPLYLSLAQTYFDTGQHESATHYYKLELNCWLGNSLETCKTLLNIADCEQSAGKDYATLERLYDKALEAAVEGKDRRLQRRCLKLLAGVQSEFGESDANAETTARIETLAVDDDDEEDDEESTQKSEIPDDSSVPSDESSTDDEADERPSALLTQYGHSRRKKFRLRRNEKGETPLHRACIDGDVKLATRLLDQGHPVNIRDHSGWLPLHEAANHDHVALVGLLLERGAWINDRGGEHCDGITPLHDAASNGNLAVIRLLIEKGASVLVKTTSGDTVLRCLEKWQERAENSTDSEIMSESVQVIEELKDAMKNAAEKLRQGVAKTIMSQESNVNARSSTPTCEALISETNQGQSKTDNWLVDDVRPSVQHSRKRHRSNHSHVNETISSSCGRRSIKSRQQTNYTRVEKRARTRSRPTTSTMSNAPEAEVNQEDSDFFDFDDNEDDDHRSRSPDELWDTPGSDSEAIFFTPEIHRRPASVNIQNDRTNPSFLRIKVKILDKLLLVPAPAEETISWLANEAANRYYILYGLRPVLALSTKEGALLASVDKVHLVISAEDEVVGTIDSWELPPLNERYAEACTALSTAACKNIADILTRSKGTVFLRNLRLNVNRLRPICRALQCQYSLTELVLAGNRFGDEGLQFLSPAMLHLPSLQILDLSCNEITDSGLCHLATAMSSSTIALQRLKTLKLGFNPLINGASCPTSLLAVLLSLKALEELHLQSCCDIVEQGPNHDAFRTIVSKVTSLRHLDLSFNRLTEQLATQLANPTLTLLRKLNLRGVTTSTVMARVLCDALGRLFEDPRCRLEELDLALCSLDDECCASLAESVVRGRCHKLKFVDLSFNALLSPNSSLSVAKSIADDVRF